MDLRQRIHELRVREHGDSYLSMTADEKRAFAEESEKFYQGALRSIESRRKKKLVDVTLGEFMDELTRVFDEKILPFIEK